MPTRALLLVDHGSRVAASNAQLVEVARLVEAELGDGTPQTVQPPGVTY